MKRYISKIIAIVFVFMIFISSMVFAEEPDIKVKVQPGFEGVFKYGYTVPIIVEVQNNKKDIDGELNFEVETQQGHAVLYSISVNIPKGSTKKYTSCIPVTKSGNVGLKIMNGKEEVYNESVYINTGSSSETAMVGILSDDFDSVNYFQDSRRRTDGVKLNEKLFPERLDVLKMFDVILINNFDTSKLSKIQYTALKNWVSKGGLLIIGTGPSNAKTLALFKDDFISGRIGNLEEINTKALGNFIGKPADTMKLSALSMDINGSKPYIKEGNFTLVHHIQKGGGNVIISSFDLGLKPVSDWDDNKTLGSGILENFLVYTTNDNDINMKMYNEHYYLLNNVLMNMPELSMPGPRKFLTIAIIYIILAGPVSYIILKKKDKRGLMWFTVPALSLIFAVVMYMIGFGTRITKPIANVVSVVNISEGGSMDVESYAGIFSPIKSDMTVEAGEGMSISPWTGNPEMYYVSAQSNNVSKIIDAKVRTSSKTSIDFYKSGIWNMKTLAIQNEETKKGSIESNINYTNSKFEGTIKNNTGMDFEICYIIGPDRYIEVKEIKNGETKNISDTGSSYTYTGDILSNLDPYRKPLQGKLTNNEILEMRKNRQRMELLNYFFTSGIYKNGGLKLIAIASAPISGDIIVNKASVKKYERELIVSDINISFKNGKSVEYPYGYVVPASLTSTFRGYDVYSQMYYGRGQIEETFKVENDITVQEIGFKVDINSKSGSGKSNDIKEYLWNYKTDAWEEQNLNYLTISGGDISKFIGPDNTLRLKIESDDDSASIRRPRISLKGSVK